MTELLLTLYEALIIEIGVILLILLAIQAAINKFPFFFAIISIEPCGYVVGGVIIVFTRNWIPEYVLFKTIFVTVTYIEVGFVSIVHWIDEETFTRAWHDGEDKMLFVFTALLGQYFGNTIVSTVLYGIIIAGVTVTSIPADVLVVDGEAVIEHVRIP